MNNENTPLGMAVQYLYGQGTIKKDKDIAEKTGYNKPPFGIPLRFIDAVCRGVVTDRPVYRHGDPDGSDALLVRLVCEERWTHGKIHVVPVLPVWGKTRVRQRYLQNAQKLLEVVKSCQSG